MFNRLISAEVKLSKVCSLNLCPIVVLDLLHWWNCSQHDKELFST